MRILALMFLLLAFLSFLTGILARFLHPAFIPHDPITLMNAADLFLLFSIALAVLHLVRIQDKPRDRNGD